MSVNKVFLLGYVGRDPEIRYPEKDRPVAFLSLATNETTASGQELTEWHNLVMGGKNAQFAERYIRKGTQIFVEGKLKTREYEDRMKITRKRTEIIVERLEIIGRNNTNP